MSEVKTIRINKVLRELNISLDRAVEQLAAHGFEIDARPTSKISEQEYQLLLDAFQTDRTKREASEEVSEEKRKEKEAIRQRIEEEKETKAQVFQARTELKGLRKVGKIDLEQKPEDKPEPKTEIKPQPVEENNLEEIVEEPTNSTPEEEPKPAAKTEATPETPEEDGTEKVTTKYKKLTGLKITGDKIDLKKFEKKPSSSSTDQGDRRRRRKRITKNTGALTQGKSNKPKPKQQKNPAHEEPSDEEIQKQIRETLEKLQGKTTKSKGAKYRREKRDSHRQKTEDDAAQQQAESKVLKVTEFVTVGEIATMMEISSTEIISACMTLGSW